MKILILILSFAMAETPSAVLIDEKCTIKIKFSAYERSFNIADLQYLSTQPGTIPHFSKLDRRLSSLENLKAIVQANSNAATIVPLSGDNPTECDAMKGLAEKLRKRLKDKAWPDENMQNHITQTLRGLPPFKLPALGNETPSTGPAPVSSSRK